MIHYSVRQYLVTIHVSLLVLWNVHALSRRFKRNYTGVWLGNAVPQLMNTAFIRTRSCRRLSDHWALRNHSGERRHSRRLSSGFACQRLRLLVVWLDRWTNSVSYSTHSSARNEYKLYLMWKESSDSGAACDVTPTRALPSHLRVCLGHQWLIPTVAYVTAAWLINGLNQ